MLVFEMESGDILLSVVVMELGLGFIHRFISDREDDKERDDTSVNVMFSSLLQSLATQSQVCRKPSTSSHDEPIASVPTVEQYSTAMSDDWYKKVGEYV